MTRQSVYVESFHCAQCLRSLESYRDMLTANSSTAIARVPHETRVKRSVDALALIPHTIKSDRSKANWKRPEYRKKMDLAHEVLAMSESFKRTCSAATKKKFEDADYVAKITAARRRYWQDPEYRVRRVLNVKQFIARARAIHGDKYDYSLVSFDVVARNTKVKIICKEHGNFEQRPLWHIIYDNGCPSCKTLISKPHQEIINYIKSLYDGEIVINDRKFIGFELDIVLPELKLAIEFNGNWYHSHYDSKHLSKYLHHIKATKCYNLGIALFQIFEYDWNNLLKRHIVLGMIANKLGKSVRRYARQCIVKELTNAEQTQFFNTNHLYGGKSAHCAFGLFLGGDLVCAMSFQKHSKHWEIVRLSTKTGIVVAGGASRLFKHFVKTYQPQVVKTYADRATSNGGVYLKLGFQFDGITKPGYKYFKGNRVFSRLKFQKHKLAKLLPNFDAAKTELENMFAAGYKAIWDAGHARYVWLYSKEDKL